MPRLRLKLRWLMVVVALVAVVASGLREQARLKRLSKEYNARAIYFARRRAFFGQNLTLTHAAWEANNLARRQANEGAWFKIGGTPSPEKCRRLAPYYRSLWQKYERAARYPYLPVEPDPPEPE